MQRIRCEERANWRDKSASVGFVYLMLDGAPYWDERAYYGFGASAKTAFRGTAGFRKK